MRGDPHHALKLEELGRRQISGAEFTHVRRQESKQDLTFDLHARVLDGTVGFLLHRLGFQKQSCQFTLDEQCFTHELSPDVSLDAFAQAFTSAVTSFRDASQKLGGLLDPSSHRRVAGFDGHRGTISKFLKGTDDPPLRFALTWIESPEAVGWVRHVHIAPNVRYDMAHLMADVLELEFFEECPHFDFEPCFWLLTPRGRGFDPVAASMIHEGFDRLPRIVAEGLAALADTEVALHSVKLGFPHSPRRVLRKLVKTAEALASTGTPPQSQPGNGFEFDVALSFAGSERHLAEELARLLKQAQITVFYDKDHAAKLWGKDLTVVLDEVYRKKARLCVAFVSREYRDRDWPSHELRSARARALKERDAYLLPIQVEPVELEGVPPTIGYLSLTDHPLEDIAKILIEKIRASR